MASWSSIKTSIGDLLNNASKQISGIWHDVTTLPKGTTLWGTGGHKTTKDYGFFNYPGVNVDKGITAKPKYGSQTLIGKKWPEPTSQFKYSLSPSIKGITQPTPRRPIPELPPPRQIALMEKLRKKIPFSRRPIPNIRAYEAASQPTHFLRKYLKEKYRIK